ncbi:hypothetical protein [Dyella nitratireducens]|nr:hypothetical protein [Dyella nitratireducens]
MASVVFMVLAILLSMAARADKPTLQAHSAYQTIVPLTVVPYPCVSVAATGARILLAKDDLVALSTSGAQDSSQSDKQRMAFLAVGRASRLLSKVTPTQDDLGCAVISLDISMEDRDTLFVISELLEEGKAAVVREGRRTPELKIFVDHASSSIMGSENFRFADGTPFLSLTTWVSEATINIKHGLVINDLANAAAQVRHTSSMGVPR